MKRIKYHFFKGIILLALFTFSCDQEDERINLDNVLIENSKFNRVTLRSAVMGSGVSNVTERGFCWSKAPDPSILDNTIVDTDISGTEFSLDLLNLENNIQYHVRSYAINGSGVSYSNESQFTLWLNSPHEPVKDIDDNEYATIRIGNQVWMKENLKVTRYRNGDPILNITLDDDLEWLGTSSGAYSVYEDDMENKDEYGLLYNGYAIFDERCICAAGWHVPDRDEWQKLIEYLDGEQFAGNALKSIEYWSQLDITARDLSGFSAVPAGLRVHARPESQNTSYISADDEAFFATSSQTAFENVLWYVNLSNERPMVRISDGITRLSGQSVRCVKDQDISTTE